MSIHPKLKKFVLQKLEEDLINKEILPYKNEFWILESENKEWFIYLDAQGSVWYNQHFFQKYKDVFSIESREFSKIMKEWIETKLGFRVSIVARRQSNLTYIIDGMLRSEKNNWTLQNRFGFSYNIVKRYVDLKKNTKNTILEDFMIS